jgi:hypothetical protein
MRGLGLVFLAACSFTPHVDNGSVDASDGNGSAAAPTSDAHVTPDASQGSGQPGPGSDGCGAPIGFGGGGRGGGGNGHNGCGPR